MLQKCKGGLKKLESVCGIPRNFARPGVATARLRNGSSFSAFWIIAYASPFTVAMAINNTVLKIEFGP